MSGTSGSYNAVTWLLDRNVDEGRGAKLAFTDTVSELSYGDLQRQSRRVANMLRRLGVRREERVAMIMLDTVDFPVRVPRRDPRRHRAGAAQHAADFGSICLCAGGLPRPRAVHFRSAAAGREGHGRADAGSRTCHRRPARTRTATRNSPTNSRAKAIHLRPRRPIPTSRRSGSIRRARPACPRACGICIPISPRPRRPTPNRCSAFARTMSACRRQNCSSPTASATR